MAVNNFEITVIGLILRMNDRKNLEIEAVLCWLGQMVGPGTTSFPE